MTLAQVFVLKNCAALVVGGVGIASGDILLCFLCGETVVRHGTCGGESWVLTQIYLLFFGIAFKGGMM